MHLRCRDHGVQESLYCSSSTFFERVWIITFILMYIIKLIFVAQVMSLSLERGQCILFLLHGSFVELLTFYELFSEYEGPRYWRFETENGLYQKIEKFATRHGAQYHPQEIYLCVMNDIIFYWNFLSISFLFNKALILLHWCDQIKLSGFYFYFVFLLSILLHFSSSFYVRCLLHIHLCLGIPWRVWQTSIAVRSSCRTRKSAMKSAASKPSIRLTRRYNARTHVHTQNPYHTRMQYKSEMKSAALKHSTRLTSRYHCPHACTHTHILSPLL